MHEGAVAEVKICNSPFFSFPPRMRASPSVPTVYALLKNSRRHFDCPIDSFFSMRCFAENMEPHE